MKSQSQSPDSRPAQQSAAGCLRLNSRPIGSTVYDRHSLSHAHKASLFSPNDSLATPEWCGYQRHLPEGEWKNYAGGCDSLQPCRMIRGELPV